MYILCGSFHSHLQILEFTGSTLQTYTIAQPDFSDYTWLAKHPHLPDIIYAAQASPDKEYGQLAVVKLDREAKSPKDWTFEILQQVSTGGKDPCHLNVNDDGDVLTVTNYDGSNVLTTTLNAEGFIQQAQSQVLVFQGGGPNAERQEAAHPHGAFYHPEWKAWLVVDLGSDSVRILDKGQQVGCFDLRAGDGPRHLALHPRGQYCYVVNELANTVAVFRLPREREAPYAHWLSATSVLPQGASGRGMSAAAILISNDGRHLYVTNRDQGHAQGDAIIHFSIGEDGQSIKWAGEYRTNLDHPRGAGLLGKDSQYLIAGSRTETGAVIYARDASTGALKERARAMDVIKPSCFVEI